MIDESILNVNDDDLIEILLFGNCKFSLERNLSIIKASINYIVSSLGGSIAYTLFLCYLHFYNFFFSLGFTPCKAAQPLRGMELQEKEAQKY